MMRPMRLVSISVLLGLACSQRRPRDELWTTQTECGVPAPPALPKYEAAWERGVDSLTVRARVHGVTGVRDMMTPYAWLDSAWEGRSHVDAAGRVALRAASGGTHVLHVKALANTRRDFLVSVPLPSDSVVVVNLPGADGDIGCGGYLRVPVKR